MGVESGGQGDSHRKSARMILETGAVRCPGRGGQSVNPNVTTFYRTNYTQRHTEDGGVHVDRVGVSTPAARLGHVPLMPRRALHREALTGTVIRS